MRQITVGIPVFNGMPYLPESLESILRQSHSDFDILVVNDGSTDESSQYLRSIRDSRLRVVEQENRGLTATLNRMLHVVNTPWLARHDADDVAYPHRLARAVESINEYPGAGMFYTLAEYYPAGSLGKYRITKGNPGEIRKIVRSGNLPAICHSTVTLNVERIRAVGGYRFDLHVEDTDLWWRTALHYDIRFIPEVLTGYRQILQSVTSVNIERQALNVLYVQYLLISHLWKRKPLAYEEACGPLRQLVNPRRIKFRNYLRAANIELGRGNKSMAVMQATGAFLTSPESFMRRVWDECSAGRTISLGESTALFKKYENILWPDLGENYCTSFEPLSPPAKPELHT